MKKLLCFVRKAEFFHPQLFVKKEIHIKSDYSVTGKMLFVIPKHIKNIYQNLEVNHMKQIFIIIKTMFYGISNDEMLFTIDIFWSD